MANLGDVLHKGLVAVLATVSLVGGISVALSMSERFSYHRHAKEEAALAAGTAEGQQQQPEQQKQ